FKAGADAASPFSARSGHLFLRGRATEAGFGGGGGSAAGAGAGQRVRGGTGAPTTGGRLGFTFLGPPVRGRGVGGRGRAGGRIGRGGRSILPLASPGALGDGGQVGEGGLLAGLLHQVEDQLDGPELGVGDVQARRVAEEVEHGLVVDGPLDAQPDRLEEPVQL